METALSYVVAASIFAMLVLGINAVYSKVSYPLAGVVAAIGMHIGLSLFAGNTENITALETLPFAIKNFSAVAFLVSGVASPPRLLRAWHANAVREFEAQDLEKASLLPGYLGFAESMIEPAANS